MIRIIQKPALTLQTDEIIRVAVMPPSAYLQLRQNRGQLALHALCSRGEVASVFTSDADHARDLASRLRSGTVGQNERRADDQIAFGGFKQSGVGREGGRKESFPMWR